MSGLEPSIALWRQLSGRAPGPPRSLLPQEEREVAAGVHRLAQGFGRRSIAGQRYLEEPDLLGAYLLFYAPISEAQLADLLDRAGIAGEGSALDLGSGPGPCARVLLARGHRPVLALDHSEAALRLAGRRCGPGLQTRSWSWGEELPEGPFDLIVAGHVFNELARREADRVDQRLALLQSLWARLGPQGRVVLLEPARHEINAELLELRDRTAAAGMPIEGPCLGQLRCPARAEGAACHAELRGRLPELVSRLARLAHVDRAVVAYSSLIIGRRLPRWPMGAARVLSERMVNKAGRQRHIACTAEGRLSLSAAPGQGGAWAGLGRGDLVELQRPERRQGGWGLGPESTLSLLQGPNLIAADEA